ncbi:MAG: hypothetical protein ACTH3D_10035 [Halomonas sp.]|uniref:hypothetical protein n=1 Tax=Halomonas sp. TaxID=1486246 RepID=UPI003F9058D2
MTTFDSYNLRDDWYGSDIREVPSRKARFNEHELLCDVENTDLLQAITLLHTHERKQQDIKAGKTGKQVRPVSAKRASVLDLPLEAYQRWADIVEKGFVEAAYFLKGECFYSRRELPYATQLVPLAAVMTLLGDRWREPHIHAKLSRWFWSGVLGELYGGAVETRIALDLEDLMLWFEDDAIINKTPISARTNRMIGGDAPSQYLARLQNHQQVQLSDEAMNAILEGHRIPTDALRADDFDAFYQQRKRLLLAIIEKAMGKKPLAGADDREAS